MRHLVLLIIVASFIGAQTGFSQSKSMTIKGKITDSENQPLAGASIIIKSTKAGTVTDQQGNFLVTITGLPVTLIVSHVNFDLREIQVSNTREFSVQLERNGMLDPVVTSKNLRNTMREYPFAYSRLGARSIRHLPTPSIFDAGVYLPRMDVTTSSLTFKTYSTGGFNSSGSSRVNQLVDGMDNQAPGLNFPVGIFAGPTDLDIESIEVLSGPSSALYGPGGMNGTILINSKSPFRHEGLSIIIKPGVMHLGNSGRDKASLYNDYSFRWAKKINDRFAFKIGGQYLQADDWLASDSSNYLREGTSGKLVAGNRKTDPNYDGVNVYGDETTVGGSDINDIFTAGAYLLMAQDPGRAPGLMGLMASDLPGLSPVSRTGYTEKEVIDPVTKNIKLSGSIHYRITDNIEAQLMANWATGNTVYTDDNRYALKGIKIGQYKFELKHKNWFFRTYTTQEDAGEAYSATVTTRIFNEVWKQSFDADEVRRNPVKFFDYWYGQYAAGYWASRLAGADVTTAHNTGRTIADQGRPEAGSPQFQQIFDAVRKTPIPNGGRFKEESQLWMSEGQYIFGDAVKNVEIIVGGNFKRYILDSDGTVFIDSVAPIRINEFGAYTQLTKKVFQQKLILTASGRFDKNENFKAQFTPRFAALIKVSKDHTIRMSYQTAYRFPGNLAQWIRLDVGSDYLLLGGLPWVMDYMDAKKNPVYEIGGPPTPYEYKTFKPETMSSFEAGYKGLIENKLLIDVYGYVGKYKDFIGRIGLFQPTTNRAYSITVNSSNKVKTYGFGLAMDYRMAKNYSVFFNAYSDVITDVPAGFKAYFNAPKYRFNTGITNSGMGKNERVSFSVMMRWQDAFEWEGELANGPLSAFATVDAQVSYKFPKIKSTVRIGGSNISNHYYKNAYANPSVGGLYYAAYIYNF